MKPRYGCPEADLVHYTCMRTPTPIHVDGNLDKPVWKKAAKSSRFVDMVSGTPGFLDTRMASLWDDDFLYVAYWVDEPDIQASLTERDSFVWNDKDIELFIAGPDCYYEFEINARGTIYEVFFIWQDALKKGSFFDRPEFDPMTHKPDVLGGFQDGRYGKHPRGQRWAFRDWDFPGLKSAVSLNGTLNQPDDVDKGWTVELALPWKGMELLAQGRPLPPKEGDVWRMDFSRFEALHTCGAKVVPDPGWSLNKHGVYDSHIPECFSFVHFSTKAVQA